MPGNIYSSSIDWSPDGRWLVARNQNRNRLELINPGTGDIIPVPNSNDIWGPSGSRDIRLSARSILADRCRRTNKSLAIPGRGVG
jgi:hypothetical protein